MQIATIVFLHSVDVEFNKEVNNVTCTIFNDKIHDTKLNISINLFEDIDNMFLVYSIYLKESNEDKEISRKIFSTNINMKKLFQGVRGNYLLTQFFDALQKSVKVKLEMPMRKVLPL